MDTHEWIEGSDEVPSPASGLRLAAPDLARIGQIIVQGGAWQGKQIVPGDWLDASFTRHADLNGMHYGLHWYLASDGDLPRWMSGFGNGGQRLTVQPKYDLVFVILAGNYNEPDAWKLGVRLIEGFLVPALRWKIDAD